MTLQGEGHIPVVGIGFIDGIGEFIFQNVGPVSRTGEVCIRGDLGQRVGRRRYGILAPCELSFHATRDVDNAADVAEEGPASANIGWEADLYRDVALRGRAVGKEDVVVGEKHRGDLVVIRVANNCSIAAARDIDRCLEAINVEFRPISSLAGRNGGFSVDRTGQGSGDRDEECGEVSELHFGVIV